MTDTTVLTGFIDAGDAESRPETISDELIGELKHWSDEANRGAEINLQWTQGDMTNWAYRISKYMRWLEKTVWNRLESLKGELDSETGQWGTYLQASQMAFRNHRLEQRHHPIYIYIYI